MATRQPQSRSRCPPTPTDHARERWHERADPVDDYAGLEEQLWTAWADAEPISLPVPHCHAGDEARYHPDAKVVLCRRDSVITTVYDVVGPDAELAVRRTVELQLDVDLEVSR